jgi:hypothetical protein
MISLLTLAEKCLLRFELIFINTRPFFQENYDKQAQADMNDITSIDNIYAFMKDIELTLHMIITQNLVDKEKIDLYLIYENISFISKKCSNIPYEVIKDKTKLDYVRNNLKSLYDIEIKDGFATAVYALMTEIGAKINNISPNRKDKNKKNDKKNKSFGLVKRRNMTKKQNRNSKRKTAKRKTNRTKR